MMQVGRDTELSCSCSSLKVLCTGVFSVLQDKF